MSKEIDLRGYSCPEPVIRTRKAIESLAVGESLVVLVETVTARENIKRTAVSLGYKADIEILEGEGFRINLSP